MISVCHAKNCQKAILRAGYELRRVFKSTRLFFVRLSVFIRVSQCARSVLCAHVHKRPQYKRLTIEFYNIEDSLCSKSQIYALLGLRLAHVSADRCSRPSPCAPTARVHSLSADGVVREHLSIESRNTLICLSSETKECRCTVVRIAHIFC